MNKNYFVIGMEKIKNHGIIARLGHNNRERNYTSENIKRENSYKNIVLENFTEIKTDKDMLNYAKKNMGKGKRQVKEGSSKFFEVVIDCSKNHFKNEEEHLNYLKDSYKYLKERFKGQKIINATIHMDEGKPHLHAIISYFNDELGKWNQKELYKNKTTDINEILKDFENQIGKKYNLVKGEKFELIEKLTETKTIKAVSKKRNLLGQKKIIQVKINSPKQLEKIKDKYYELKKENDDLKTQLSATKLTKKQIQVKINQQDYYTNKQNALKIHPLKFLHVAGKIIKNLDDSILINSPFRQDFKPSLSIFKTEEGNYLIHDFADGTTINTIDAYMKLNNTSYTETIKELLKLENLEVKEKVEINYYEQQQQKEYKKQEFKVQEIDKKSLKLYLLERGIEKVPEQIKQVEQYNEERNTNYYALGLKNESGGYAVRNKHFKGNINKQNLTKIDNKATKTVIIEGMFDYLSVYQKMENNVNYIVLNSINNITQNKLTQIDELLRDKEEIYLYIDRDEKGKLAKKKLENYIIENFNAKQKFEYYKYNFKDSKDINEDYIKTINTTPKERILEINKDKKIKEKGINHEFHEFRSR